jgi:NhaA family Na+:H+ antiporter
MLLGPRVPRALKVLLLSISVIDDIGAVTVIAVYYTADLSLISLLVAFMGLGLLVLLNYVGVRMLAPYVVIGLVVWVGVLNSGVHATLAGVLVALTIPLRKKDGRPLLNEVEKGLHPWTAYFILPLFAFFNSGVSLTHISFDMVISPLPMGIALGLFLGKQLGIFLFCWVVVKAGICSLNPQIRWPHVYGIACIAGVGFTMSLFIGTLAFDAPEALYASRLGVMAGSAISTIMGILVLGYCFFGKTLTSTSNSPTQMKGKKAIRT